MMKRVYTTAPWKLAINGSLLHIMLSRWWFAPFDYCNMFSSGLKTPTSYTMLYIVCVFLVLKAVSRILDWLSHGVNMSLGRSGICQDQSCTRRCYPPETLRTKNHGFGLHHRSWWLMMIYLEEVLWAKPYAFDSYTCMLSCLTVPCVQCFLLWSRDIPAAYLPEEVWIIVSG